MKVLTLKRIISILLMTMLALTTFLFIATEANFASTRYVTGKTNLGYKGHTIVYKTASTATPLKSGGKTAMISKNVYVPYLGLSGNFLKIKWGDTVGYVPTTKGVTIDMYDLNATKLTSNKTVSFGIYSGYIAKNTYVVYVNKSTGKIKWAAFSSLPAPEEKWNDPFAYLSTM